MKSILILLMAISFLPSTSSIHTPIKNANIETFKVDGNCAQCAELIEKAGFIKKSAMVRWNQVTKMATLTYDTTKTNPSFIRKRIALAGFDNVEYLAPDDIYAMLPECCRYIRVNKTIPKKAMTSEVVQFKENEVHTAIKDSILRAENNQALTEETKPNDHINHPVPDLAETSRPIENSEKKSDQKKNDEKTTKPSMPSKKVTVKPTLNDHTEYTIPMKNQLKPNQLIAIFDQYFAVKDGLVKTDGNTVTTHAKELLIAINSVDMQSLDAETHTVWMKILKALKSDSESMSKSKDIGRQREYFMNLSKNMYTLIKASNLGIPMYYQHCPMANNGKGADWLSKEMAIKNPYFGSQMLTCGNTKETIK